MLTVFREMAHSIARQLAHLEADKQRLDREVSDEQQDAVLAEVLEQAIADGERAVERTPEQLEVLREAGVVDAGGYGLVLILAGVVAGLRGERRRAPEVAHHEAPPLTRPHHEDSRYRYCTNFIVSGTGLARARVRAAARGARRLGARRRRRGDAEGPRPHRRAGGGGRALRGRRRRSTNLDVADMREQIAERERGWRGAAPGRRGRRRRRAWSGSSASSARTSSPAARRSTPRPTSCSPGSTRSPAEEVLVLPNSSNVVMAAERACELSEKPARVVACDLPAGGPAGAGRARRRAGRRGERGAARRRAGDDRHRRRRPGRPRRRAGSLSPR